MVVVYNDNLKKDNLKRQYNYQTRIVQIPNLKTKILSEHMSCAPNNELASDKLIDLKDLLKGSQNEESYTLNGKYLRILTFHYC